ncbi:MAG: MoaD/ThiS family protein [Acidobacteria bacterium]|nr:MoaD/ThiS family protein [Acidobacteriota bacterium]
MVRIRFTTLFAERIGGISAVEVSAGTVESALRALTDRHPELVPLIWKDEGTVNPVIVLFLNDRQLGPRQFGASVKPGDEIDIIPALEGGCGPPLSAAIAIAAPHPSGFGETQDVTSTRHWRP